MDNWTYADWLRHQKAEIRKDFALEIERESDKRENAMLRELVIKVQSKAS